MDALDEVKWAAGFFDGEGTTSCNSGTNKKQGTWIHRLHLSVSQAEHRIGVVPNELLTLKRLFGGSISPKRTTSERRNQWQWHVTSAIARQGLAMMLPYLHEAKQEQADQARVRWMDRRDLGQAWETERRTRR